MELPEAVHEAAVDAHTGERIAMHCGRGSLVQLGPLDVHGPPLRLSLHERAIAAKPTSAAAGGAGGGGGSASNVVALMYSLHEREHLYIVQPREATLWDLGTGQALGAIRLDRTDHNFTAISQSLALPSTLLAAHNDGQLSLWERCVVPADGGAAHKPPAEAQVAVVDGVESPPRTPATGASEPMASDAAALPDAPADVRVSFAFRLMVPLLKGGGSALLAFTPSMPDGERFGGVSADGRVWLWRLPSGPPARRVVPSPEHGPVTSTTMSVAASRWQLQQRGLLQAVSAKVASLAMQPAGGRLLAVGMANGRVLLVELRNDDDAYPAGDSAAPSAATSTGHSAAGRTTAGEAAGPADDSKQMCLHGARFVTVGEYEVHSEEARGLQWVGARKLFSYSTTEGGAGRWGNTVRLLRLPSGRCTDACPAVRDAPAPLCGIRASPSGRRLVLIYKDSPLQIWDLPTRTPLASHFVAMPGSAALEWIPPAAACTPIAGTVAGTVGGTVAGTTRRAADDASEELVFAVPDGSLFRVRVRGTKLLSSRSSSGEDEEFEIPEGVVTALALHGPWVVSGTAEGTLSIWHTKEPSARYAIATHRGAVRSVALHTLRKPPLADVVNNAPSTRPSWPSHPLRAQASDPLGATAAARPPTSEGGCLMLVLFQEGDLALWTLPASEPWALASPSLPSRASLGPSRAVAATFAPDGQPLIACADGCLRLLTRELHRGNAPARGRIGGSSMLAPKRERLLLQTALLHASEEGAMTPPLAAPPQELDALRDAPSLPTRCRLVAERLGCEQDARFWAIAEALLSRPRPPPPPPPAAVPTGALPAQPADSPADGAPRTPLPSLPSRFGALREADDVREDELARLTERLVPSRQPAREVVRRGALTSISFGARSRAVALLLGIGRRGGERADSERAALEGERDALLACVVAGYVRPEMHAAAIGAVAERFVAAGKLSLAVPLLFLVGRGAEACAQLQRVGRWEYAATLAKASLPPAERSSVLGAWASHLLGRGDVHRAIEVLLSLGRVQEVAERLLEVHAYDKAALLLCALREAHELRRGALAGFAFRGAARVLLEYAGFLSRLSMNTLAVRYTGLACATAESAAAADAGAEEALTEIEAAQLVCQLAKLQERREQVE